jgi:hypothetical protein
MNKTLRLVSLLMAGVLAWSWVGAGAIEARAGQSAMPLRSLPAQVRLVYDVLAGKDGLRLGQAVYTWQAEGGRYRLESVAEAQGMTSLFLGGRVVETSEGRLDGQGLVPERFTHLKKEKLKGSARFDWAGSQLILTRGIEPLAKGTQDVLSFPFHLALTVTENTAVWPMSVTNGRYLKHYQFQVVGRERLRVGKTTMDVLHVRGSRAGEDTLDVWLAPERGWLPARIRTQDDKDVPVELVLVS